MIDPAKTILFVGAGASQSLGLPSWSGLADEIARQLDFDPEVFRLYGSPLALAEYYRLTQDGVGQLLSWMDTEWHVAGKEIADSKLHQTIVKAGFRKIYTTNFDRWLEKACERWSVPYRKILRVSDIALVEDGELEIVKFHGDFDDAATLVLTESSYFERFEFESPMDVILRADALKYSILFVGYSLSDPNMRYLFHKLEKLWREAGADVRRPKNHIFMMYHNPVDEAIFGSWGITPIPNEADKPEDGLRDFLEKIGK